ncbi:hypothetical protein HOLleu_11680 [Holothuria leucospilota]|uniref:Uncharacterized protein n=1 Tax=Holothuria leucospilota TaxID=206669 RepID=A0A9Q1HGL9_HOLLE|nr:hypothetical protein HOLleu_11680 [Holothuria leucospilota]
MEFSVYLQKKCNMDMQYYLQTCNTGIPRVSSTDLKCWNAYSIISKPVTTAYLRIIYKSIIMEFSVYLQKKHMDMQYHLQTCNTGIPRVSSTDLKCWNAYSIISKPVTTGYLRIINSSITMEFTVYLQKKWNMGL